MDEVTALVLGKALDGLAMRASAISQNIANVNSPAFSRLQVQFEAELSKAAQSGADAVRSVEPRYLQSPAGSGPGEIRLDLEMANASQTSLRYSALVEVLGRQMQIARLAVGGGRQ